MTYLQQFVKALSVNSTPDGSGWTPTILYLHLLVLVEMFIFAVIPIALSKVELCHTRSVESSITGEARSLRGNRLSPYTSLKFAARNNQKTQIGRRESGYINQPALEVVTLSPSPRLIVLSRKGQASDYPPCLALFIRCFQLPR
jgi:hypothetical protein